MKDRSKTTWGELSWVEHRVLTHRSVVLTMAQSAMATIPFRWMLQDRKSSEVSTVFCFNASASAQVPPFPRSLLPRSNPVRLPEAVPNALASCCAKKQDTSQSPAGPSPHQGCTQRSRNESTGVCLSPLLLRVSGYDYWPVPES